MSGFHDTERTMVQMSEKQADALITAIDKNQLAQYGITEAEKLSAGEGNSGPTLIEMPSSQAEELKRRIKGGELEHLGITRADIIERTPLRNPEEFMRGVTDRWSSRGSSEGYKNSRVYKHPETSKGPKGRIL